MSKRCYNYDSGEYEDIDENGYSYTQGGYVSNWDDSEYEEERRREEEEEERRREEEEEMMKNIMDTHIGDCYSVLIRELNNTVNPKKARKIIVHTLNVYSNCRKIVKKLKKPREVDENLLYKAAILHDIAKGSFGDSHNKKVGIILDLYFEENKNSQEYRNKLIAIIEAHRGEFEPDREILKEAIILRMADKIDKYRKEQK